MKSCLTCVYSGIMKSADGSLLKVCRYKPPTVHMIMQSLPDGRVQQGSVTCWPAIEGTDWCGSHVEQIVANG